MERHGTSRWIGHLAAGLMLAHAVLSAYWAAGGTALLNLLSDGIQEQADLRESWFIAMIWGIALLKAFVALIGLVLVQGWTASVPRVLLLMVTWGTGIILTLYGLTNVLGGVLNLAGIVGASGERSTAFWAYLLLWSPWWLAIGTCYLLLSWWQTTSLRTTVLTRSGRVSGAK